MNKSLKETKKSLKVGFIFFQRMVAMLLSVGMILADVPSYASVIPSAKPTEQRTPDLEIPEEIGTVDEYHQGTSGKTIIYIQDAHDSLEAQENIANIVNHLVEHHKVKTVFEEGYEGPVPSDEYFGFIKNPEVKEKVSYFLMDKLRLGGAEYAHVNQKEEFELIGIDSLKLHRENIEAYRRSAKVQEETATDLLALEKEIKKMANQYFPKELKAWMKLRKRLDDGELQLLDYLTRSQKLILKDFSSDFFNDRYPNIVLLLAAEKIQSKQMLVNVKQSLNYKSLFEEMYQLGKDFARLHLADKRDQQTFDYYKKIQLLIKLNRIEITSEEYQAIKKEFEILKTEDMANFIAQETKKSIVLSKKWEENIQNAIKFYEIAIARDEVFEKAINESFPQQKKSKTSVLVFGGFHKENIKQILNKQGFSYYIVTPRITSLSEIHQSYYKQLMGIGYHDFERPLLAATAVPAEDVYTTRIGLDEVRAVHAALPSEIGDLWMRELEENLANAASETRMDDVDGFVKELYETTIENDQSEPISASKFTRFRARATVQTPDGQRREIVFLSTVHDQDYPSGDRPTESEKEFIRDSLNTCSGCSTLLVEHSHFDDPEYLQNKLKDIAPGSTVVSPDYLGEKHERRKSSNEMYYAIQQASEQGMTAVNFDIVDNIDALKFLYDELGLEETTYYLILRYMGFYFSSTALPEAIHRIYQEVGLDVPLIHLKRLHSRFHKNYSHSFLHRKAKVDDALREKFMHKAILETEGDIVAIAHTEHLLQVILRLQPSIIDFKVEATEVAEGMFATFATGKYKAPRKDIDWSKDERVKRVRETLAVEMLEGMEATTTLIGEKDIAVSGEEIDWSKDEEVMKVREAIDGLIPTYDDGKAEEIAAKVYDSYRDLFSQIEIKGRRPFILSRDDENKSHPSFDIKSLTGGKIGNLSMMFYEFEQGSFKLIYKIEATSQGDKRVADLEREFYRILKATLPSAVQLDVRDHGKPKKVTAKVYDSYRDLFSGIEIDGKKPFILSRDDEEKSFLYFDIESLAGTKIGHLSMMFHEFEQGKFKIIYQIESNTENDERTTNLDREFYRILKATVPPGIELEIRSPIEKRGTLAELYDLLPPSAMSSEASEVLLELERMDQMDAGTKFGVKDHLDGLYSAGRAVLNDHLVKAYQNPANLPDRWPAFKRVRQIERSLLFSPEVGIETSESTNAVYVVNKLGGEEFSDPKEKTDPMVRENSLDEIKQIWHAQLNALPLETTVETEFVFMDKSGKRRDIVIVPANFQQLKQRAFYAETPERAIAMIEQLIDDILNKLTDNHQNRYALVDEDQLIQKHSDEWDLSPVESVIVNLRIAIERLRRFAAPSIASVEEGKRLVSEQLEQLPNRLELPRFSMRFSDAENMELDNEVDLTEIKNRTVNAEDLAGTADQIKNIALELLASWTRDHSKRFEFLKDEFVYPFTQLRRVDITRGRIDLVYVIWELLHIAQRMERGLTVESGRSETRALQAERQYLKPAVTDDVGTKKPNPTNLKQWLSRSESRERNIYLSADAAFDVNGGPEANMLALAHDLKGSKVKLVVYSTGSRSIPRSETRDLGIRFVNGDLNEAHRLWGKQGKVPGVLVATAESEIRRHAAFLMGTKIKKLLDPEKLLYPAYVLAVSDGNMPWYFNQDQDTGAYSVRSELRQIAEDHLRNLVVAIAA